MTYDIDRHRVTCGNVMDGLEMLMQGEKASVFYSDPPWGQGNLRYWNTMNKKHNGVDVPPDDYSKFLNQIFHVAKTYTDGIVFIEYGIKWKDDIVRIGEQHGLRHGGVATIKYKSGSRWLPHNLHVFTTEPIFIDHLYVSSLEGMTGLDCLIKAVTPFRKENGIILDPCCGLGMTAQLALRLGMRFRGNELNAKRLCTTMKKLERGK